MEGNYIFQVTPESFQADVVEQSKSAPVLLLFWAEEVPPSSEARASLEAIVNSNQGKILLGLVNVAQDQSLAQHLQVQGLPSIRVISDGQLVEQLDGPQSETSMRELVDRLTMSSAEVLKDQLQIFIREKDYEQALAILEQAIKEEPNNHSFRVELADILGLQGNMEEARGVLVTIPQDVAERDRPQTRIEFYDEVAAIEDLSESRLSPDTDDTEELYRSALLAVVEQDYEYALDQCLRILKTDREFGEDKGRTTMIRIFSLLGKGSELAKQYRRKMFAYMH